MNYYALQVETGGEAGFIGRASDALAERRAAQRFFLPRRNLFIRRKGKTAPETHPLFPGYVFLEAPGVDGELYRVIKAVRGFCRFLKSDRDINALTGGDREMIIHFTAHGGRISKAYFDEHDRIVITEGPLKGYEGAIEKVNKRQRRAKVRLGFAGNWFLVDLAFEAIEKNRG